MPEKVFALPLPRVGRRGTTTTDFERLVRLLRDSDDATRTLTTWIGVPVRLHIMRRVNDRLMPEEFCHFDTVRAVPVQRRHTRLLDADDRPLVEGTATVVLGRLPYATDRALRLDDTPLGTLLSSLRARRHTLGVVRGDGSESAGEGVLLDITARLDVGGRPVAFLRERYLAPVLSE